MNRPKEAEPLLKKSLQTHKELVRDFPKRPDYLDGLSITLLRQAHFFNEVNRLKEAAETFDQARELLEKLVELRTYRDRRYDLARIYGDLGMVLRQLKVPRAEEYCRKGHDLMKSLPAERAHVQMQLGVGLNNLAIFLRDRRQWAEARLLLEQAIVHQQTALKAEPKSRLCRMYLGKHYANLAQVLAELGEPARSEEIFRREFDLLEEVVAAFPDDVQLQQLLANSLGKQAERHRNANRPEEAEAAYLRSVALYQKLVARSPSYAPYRNELGAMLNDLATGLWGRGKPDQARPYLEEAIVHQRQALNQDPTNPRYRLFLRHHYANLADVWLTQGDHVQAAASAEALILAIPDWWNSHYTAAQRLGRCAEVVAKDARLPEVDRSALCSKYALRFKKLSREAARRRPDDPAVCNNLAWFLATDADPHFHDGKLAVELAKPLVQSQPKNAGFWNTLGAAHYRAGEWREAIANLNESMRLNRGGIPADWLFLAMAHWKVDQKKEAREWYGRAIHWMEKNDPKDEELRRFLAEAEALLELKKK